MFGWSTVVFHEYRVGDKLRYLEAEAFSMAHLEEPMLDDPPARRMLEFDVPIFVFQGRHDHQTEFDVTRAYFEALKAPHKEMVVFENAAHLVPFEQPEAFVRAMVDRVLPWALPGVNRDGG
ncbi:MAG: alpha/beta hydrolase [Deltaproteobacteria bacterium]|nr:alpha/beta hydrolase [Deltaproteobacteria bacterium]MBW2392729.1 alpha/beta hydrolase [Deltaproteobacteria bacterium]